MMPVVWTIPGLGWEVPGYGLMLMITLLGSILWAARRATRSGANPDVILNTGFIAVIAGVVGARAMHVYHYWDSFANRSNVVEMIWAIIDVRQGGLEVYGGVILTTICSVAYLFFWGHSIRWYLDIVAPSVALGMGVGRLGCFLNGCCFGAVCDLPWSVQFPYGTGPAIEHFQKRLTDLNLPPELVLNMGHGDRPFTHEDFRVPAEQVESLRNALRPQLQEFNKAISAMAKPPTDAQILAVRAAEAAAKTALASQARLARAFPVALQLERYPSLTYAQLQALARTKPSLHVHPAQIYSVITLTLLALALNALYYRRTRDGQVICALFLIEPIARWTLEIVRADNPVDTAGFTISQFISMVICGLALIGLISLKFLPPRSPKAKLWVPEDDDAPAKSAVGKSVASAK